MKGKDKVTPAAESAAKAIEKVGESSKKVTKETKKDWGGVGDLLGGLLPRNLQRTMRAFKSTGRQVGRLSKSFKVLKGAIIATGIGALVVLLGELIANWDAISNSILRASSATRDNTEATKENLQAEQDRLDLISETENSLKLQGATEEELLAMRKQAAEDAVKAQEAVLEATKEEQAEIQRNAERAQKIAQVLFAALSLPLTILLGMIDGVSNGLALIGAIESPTTLLSDLTAWEAGLIGFDPEETAEEGQKAIEEQEKKLRQMQNKRDGFVLKQQADDKRIEDQAAQEKVQRTKQQEANDKFLADRQLKARQEMQLRLIEDDDKRAKQKLINQYEAEKLELEARDAEFTQLLELRLAHQMDLDAIDAGVKTRKEAADQAILDQQQALADQLYSNTLTDFEREMQRLEQEYDAKVILAGDNALLLEQIEEEHIAKIDKLEEDAAQDKKDLDAEVLADKIDGQMALAQATTGVLKMVGKQMEEGSEQQKAFAVADILLNQAMAMSSAIRGAVDAAAALGPAAPVMTPILMVQMLGMVLGGFASINQVLSKAGASGGGGVGGGSAQVRSGFADTSVTPLPARTETPEMQAYVVQTQLEGQMASSQRMMSKTSL
tara:strand:- start:3621 stop:5456 length:1836 start_codon:yes stop_codon:yes gene_type:complete